MWGQPRVAQAAWLPETFRELHIDAHFAGLPVPYEDFNAAIPGLALGRISYTT